ncbi:MAG: DUF4440 domain-containing protein [Coprobacillaceae bacterium]
MDKIITISKQLWKAMQDKNIDVLKKYTHEETVFVHMGATFTSDEELDVVKER